MDYADIVRQIQATPGGSSLIALREIKALPGILWDDEIVERIVSGTYLDRFGVLVATNKRVIFVDKGLIYGVRVEDFPYSNITSIRYKVGLIMGEITIFASGNSAEIKMIHKNLVQNFCENVRAKISNVQQKPPIAINLQNIQPSPNSIIPQIPPTVIQPLNSSPDSTKLMIYHPSGHYFLLLSKGVTIAGRHINYQNSNILDNDIIATIIENPNNPSILGMRNDSPVNWSAILSNKTLDIPPGKTITIAKSVKLNFGGILGEIFP